MTEIQMKSVSQVITEIADLIERNGLYKGWLFDLRQNDLGVPVDQCRMCFVGAMHMVIYGRPSIQFTDLPSNNVALRALRRDVVAEVFESLPEDFKDKYRNSYDRFSAVVSFSDDPRTTQEDLVFRLRQLVTGKVTDETG